MNQKIKRCIEKMKENQIDDLIVSDYYNLKYFANIDIQAMERMIALVIHQEGKPTLLLNELFLADESEDYEIVSFKDTDNAISVLAENCTGKVIGVDHNFRSGFLLELMKLHKATYCSCKDLLARIRAIKDKQEQEYLVQASLDNDAVMAKIRKEVKIGVTEKQLCNKLSEYFEEVTHEPVSFGAIVAFGENCANPHHESDDTVLKEGDTVVIDMGSHYKGYCSDMTRTFLSKNEEMEKVYEIVLEANLAAEKMVKPGVTFAEIDLAARKVIEDAGYGKYFTHRTGHGIGLEDHEPYDVSFTNTMKVEEGMCFSIEPGIYLPNVGGVRIEDLVFVTKDETLILNHYSKEKDFYD